MSSKEKNTPPLQDSTDISRLSEDQEQSPPHKRARVALACQRCRVRKQKCDGALDSCSTCTRLGLHCHYKAHLTPRPDQKKIYITALEDRVAELETYLSGLGHNSVGDDHWRQKKHRLQDAHQDELHDEQQVQDEQQKQDKQQDQQDRDPQNQQTEVLLSAVMDLLSNETSHCMKGASTITLGSVLSSVINRQKTQEPEQEKEEDFSPASISSSELTERIGPMFLSPAVATKLLEGWMKHFSTRYPIIHSVHLKELHARSHDDLDFYENSILHLVYANSGRFLETTGEAGSFYSDQHYEAGLQHMSSVLQLHDTRSIVYLLLMALYCCRVPKEPGAWTLTGLAMRLCIEINLHRRSTSGTISLKAELEKRIFWSCYYLDREVSMALARPPAISDNNLDVELPIDINEDVTDEDALYQAAQSSADSPASPATSLTTFTHFLRLRRIDSKIEQSVYNVDIKRQTAPAIIQDFLRQLSAWKLAIPPEYRDRKYTNYEPFNGIDVFMLPYYKSVRLLLYPQLSRSPLNLQYLKICAEACAGVCECYKRMHRTLKADYSPLSFQSVFLAGLTLIYCTWLAPRNYINMSGPISDCNIMLYVMAERWPAARKYRDVFERIKTSVTDVITQGNHQATRAVGILNEEMAERCRALDQGLSDGARTDYSQMINDMARQARGNGSDARPRSSRVQANDEIGSHEQSKTLQLEMWPVLEEYATRHIPMQMSSSIDSQFMNGFDEVSGLTPDWDFAAWQDGNSFNF